MNDTHKYAFFDVDNTIYEGYTTSGFYLYLVDRGVSPGVIRDKDSELMQLYRTGVVDYSEASRRCIAIHAEAIKNLSPAEVAVHADEFISQNAARLPFAAALFSRLEERGFHTYLISASAAPIVEAVGRFLHTDKLFASELEVENGVFTGNVAKMLNDEEKKHTIHRIMGHLADKSLKLGFGDSTGDIPMLSAVDYAFVINPHQKEMSTITKEKGWNLVTKESIFVEVEKILK